MYLAIIDVHSKWIKALATISNSTMVIKILHHVFAHFVSPEMIISDNGLVSEEFELFLVANCVKHITFSPYHSVTNGFARTAAQIIKEVSRK